MYFFNYYILLLNAKSCPTLPKGQSHLLSSIMTTHLDLRLYTYIYTPINANQTMITDRLNNLQDYCILLLNPKSSPTLSFKTFAQNCIKTFHLDLRLYVYTYTHYLKCSFQFNKAILL